LRDAQEHPERYESLVVRVGGFSAYWTRLSPQMQEAIISRTEHVL
jgi:formate C-acetyltransferase